VTQKGEITRENTYHLLSQGLVSRVNPALRIGLTNPSTLGCLVAKKRREREEKREKKREKDLTTDIFFQKLKKEMKKEMEKGKGKGKMDGERGGIASKKQQ